jgi:hypothetical protein
VATLADVAGSVPILWTSCLCWWTDGSYRNTVNATSQVPSNNRLELAVALASAPRINAAEGHFACPLSSGHRALAAQAQCSTDL